MNQLNKLYKKIGISYYIQRSWSGNGNGNKRKIVNLLKNSDPLKVGEIAEKLGEDKKNIDKIIKTLKKEETIISPTRCYYSLKK